MATSTSFFSWIAAGVYNFDSSRFQKASLDTRSEGWTETWGYQRDENSTKGTNREAGKKDEGEIMREIDAQSLSLQLSTPYPQLEIVLTQHRPAWFEQMLMRVASVPHIVLNSNHISNEATGKLPYLTDCISSKPPVLVGRNHPSNLEKNGNISDNSILAYLQAYRDVDLDREAGVSSDQQHALSKSFQFMINSELSKILLRLRFEDSDAWEQVYREQYIKASINHNFWSNYPSTGGKNVFFRQLHGRFQASMERANERKRLMAYGNAGQKKSVDKLLERANEVYFAIDRQLHAIQNGGSGKENYVLGTHRPALVDALLWAHLAEALCDVHLVVLLASYPRLVTYFQNMYRAYFCESDENVAGQCTWRSWNMQQNLDNAFQKVPTLTKQNPNQPGTFKDAFDLMQKSSIQNKDLRDVLEAVQGIRESENPQKPREPSSFLIYRWSMGETSRKNAEATDKEQDNPLRKKLLRDQARNDQRWLSGIVGVSVFAVLLIQGRES